nr:LacI family DNA-binding transcriptional regulator [Streptomyces globisporus]
MTSRTVTLLDVARAAGVSKSTASDALQGSGRVAEATRDRVRAVADELGYRPNSAARRLRRASTGAVGLHLPATATRLDYYMNLAFGAVERAQEDGLDMVLLAPSGAAGGRIASRVDGLLVIDPEAGDSAVPGLLDAGVPVVTGERYLGPAAAPSAAVVCDNAASLTALLDHVTERGARRPAVLAPARPPASCARRPPSATRSAPPAEAARPTKAAESRGPACSSRPASTAPPPGAPNHPSPPSTCAPPRTAAPAPNCSATSSRAAPPPTPSAATPGPWRPERPPVRRADPPRAPGPTQEARSPGPPTPHGMTRVGPKPPPPHLRNVNILRQVATGVAALTCRRAAGDKIILLPVG